MIPLREVLGEIARNHKIAPATLDEMFSGISPNFPVIFADKLPFRVDRMGMAGITLRKRVYLLRRVRNYSPERFLVLLRHEAQHVYQQQTDSLFYLHYSYHWLQALVNNIFRPRHNRRFPKRGIFYNAYRDIPEEVEAYATGNPTLTVPARRK